MKNVPFNRLALAPIGTTKSDIISGSPLIADKGKARTRIARRNRCLTVKAMAEKKTWKEETNNAAMPLARVSYVYIDGRVSWYCQLDICLIVNYLKLMKTATVVNMGTTGSKFPVHVPRLCLLRKFGRFRLFIQGISIFTVLCDWSIEGNNFSPQHPFVFNFYMTLILNFKINLLINQV